MEISGLSYFNAYFQYNNTNSDTDNKVAFPKVTAVSDETEAVTAKTTNANAIDLYQANSAKTTTESSAAGSSSGSDEETEVTTEIVTNPDGSRKLVITTKIGDTETVTNIKLAPSAEKTTENNGTEQASGLQHTSVLQRPTEFQSIHALSAYEANFMYAS